VLSLERSQQVDHDRLLVQLVEVVHLEALLRQLVLRNHTHILRELLRNILRNQAALSCVADASHVLPFVRVLIFFDCQLLHALQNVTFVYILNVRLDTRIRRRPVNRSLHWYVRYDGVFGHAYGDVALVSGIVVLEQQLA
jgi:hypothetical protein